MPDEISTGRGVKAALDNLEQYSLTNKLCRSQSYTKILTALEKHEELSLSVTERLLAVCVHDMREDMRYTANIMNIISVIVSRVQNGRYDPAPNLVPSALVVINTIKTTALLSKVESLKQLCFETLLSYPTDILIAVSDLHQEIMEIFNLYCHLKIPIKIRAQACTLLHRLLKILPQEKKRQFIEKGLAVWFSKIIPSCMVVPISKNIIMLETLELLTDELLEIDYSDNEHWQGVLERVCSTVNYPAMMKTLLQHGSDIWHRVWIVFVRLLKDQLTLCLGTIGTPINFMLCVVETAFKEDVISRCRAFECWNVLIDNFSTETNESNINKRLKLLLIPLKSNNAKAEETALAKFKCWWHLIEKFQNKTDTFIDNTLVWFLYFCFGKHNSSDKSYIIPGQISTAVKKQCIQGLVEIVGHVNCEGCTDLPKLTGGKLINTMNLVDNWNQWVFSLTSAIMMSTNSDSCLTQQQMTCLWKSFLMTIGELPENNIRKDLFAEILSIISQLVKHCGSSAKLSELILNALVLSLFDDDVTLKQLLRTKVNDENRPVCTIIQVLMDPTFHLAYHSCSFEDMVTKLTAVTDFLLDPVYSAPIFATGFVLQNLPATDMGLILWTALVESMLEYGLEFVPCDKILIDTIVWPLQIVNSFTNLTTSAMIWYTLYDTLYPKLKHFEILDKTVSKFIFTAPATNHSTTYLKLCVLLCWLKNKMAGQTCSAFDKELELLHVVTSRIDTYANYEPLFPLLVDRLVATVGILLTNVNGTAARYTLFCMKKMIKVMTLTCRQLTDASLVLSLIDILLKSLDSFVQAESYQRFIPVIIDEIIDCSAFLSQQSATKKTVLSVMKTLKSKVVETDETFKKLQAIIDDVENETIAKDKNQSSDNNKFTTPKTKEVPKRTKKKKEASIVNTVVENGEEYVVVKSNWKFNPRKLTENQKEKLQRKREDIPALYQDLSQSQDEFKLVSWKADSQDTSNSSKSESKSCSKSGSTETPSVMLFNLPSSEVVPKILENFFAQNVKKDNTVAAKEISSIDKKVKKIEAVTPKNSKSPRMALKDRVFRNVRNLIEHSEVHKENKSVSEDLNKTESIIKTPTQSKNDEMANIVNSAPPMISADRPSRVKRKPKKFDELQLLLGAKKSRQTLQGLKCESKQSNPSASDSSEVVISPASDNITGEEEVNKVNDVQVPENANSSDANVVPSASDSSEDAIPPASDNITGEEEVNKVNDVLVPENANSSDANVVIQINDNSQKEESEIENEIEMEEALPTKMDIEASLDIVKPKDNMENEQKIDYLNEENVDGTNEKKVEQINEERVEISNEGDRKEVVDSSTENSPTKNTIESSTENSPIKQVVESSSENSPTGKVLESSTENSPIGKVVESSTENCTTKKVVESSTENSPTKTVVESSTENSPTKTVVESSTENSPTKTVVESSTEKKLRSTGKKIDSPMDKEALSSTKLSVASSTEKKTEIPMDKKALSSTKKSVASSSEKKIESPMDKKAQSSTKKRVESSTENKIESTMDKKAQSSIKQSVEIATEKEIEIVQDIKIEGSINTKGDTCNTIKTKKKKKKEKVNDVHDNCPIGNNDKINNIKTKKKKMVTEKSNDIPDDRSCDSKEIVKQENFNDKNGDKSSEIQTSLNKKDAKEPSRPQQETNNKGTEEQKSSTKKCFRKSRIETELAIDMVEGHPYLNMQSPKRLTRKALESAGTSRRKSLVEKLAKYVSEVKNDKKTKEKNRDGDSSSSNSSLAVDDSQGHDTDMKDETSFTEDMPHSDDVIESSQDSTITTISVKSTKKAKKVPVVTLSKIDLLTGKVNESQSILDCVMVISESAKANQEGKDDSELPLNKTALEGSSQRDLTENLDTEPIEDKDLSEVVILANDDFPEPLTISSDETVVGPETQEIAEADTQPTDLNNFMEAFVVHKNTETSLTVVETNEIPANKKKKSPTKNKSISEISVNTPEDVTITLSDSAVVELEKESGASSPSSFGDEAKRKQDFLNNTLEISPIKNMSPDPDRNKKSPSPETSNDFVVITLSSPVHSNGEPFEKCGSPEVFTEDKVSPDKRDQSPPRVEITVTNTSPSSSLSLKKNRPQVRAGGRAAQMLGLCCDPDKVQAIIKQEKAETEEIKKTSSTSTPARRNLRILYNSVSENIEPSSESEDSETFLKFRRSLPAVDSSPSGPILKRKLVEISDDATISPASKRKRVSFHDPPVSTTVSVQKYIEPGGVRSPQNSTHKRLERQLRQHTLLKSPKRLDHAFKLDTVLNRAVESFSDTTVISSPDDTQQFSLDETPVVEIVRASELNDTDPICPDLVNCQDHIDTIASGLSSYTMKSLLVKELVGKVTTVGDLARLTELEVNRLCIKAPKVKVAKKVLTDYVFKKEEKTPLDVIENIDEALFDEPMPEVKTYVDGEAQTNTNVCVETEVQTVATPTSVTCVQTETTPTAHIIVQTDESGSKSTADIVKSCLAERPDFVEQVGVQLEYSSIQQITDKLPLSAITDVLMKKITPSGAKDLLNKVLEDQWNNTTEQNRSNSNKELSFIQDYMCGRFHPKDLILFCSDLLKSVYDKPALP